MDDHISHPLTGLLDYHRVQSFHEPGKSGNVREKLGNFLIGQGKTFTILLLLVIMIFCLLK